MDGDFFERFCSEVRPELSSSKLFFCFWIDYSVEDFTTIFTTDS